MLEISEELLRRYVTKPEPLPKDHPGVQNLWRQVNEAFQSRDALSVLDFASDLLGVGCREVRMFYLIAWAHYKLWEFSRAKKWLEFALKIYPRDIELKMLLAEIFILEQNPNSAIDLLSEIPIRENLSIETRNKLADLIARATKNPTFSFGKKLLN